MGFMDKAKDLASKNAEKVNEGIEKAEQMANEKTGGKFADHLDKAGEMAKGAAGTVEDGAESVADAATEATEEA